MGTDCRAAMPKRQIQKKPMTRSQHRRLLELKHGCPKLKVERAEARLAFATAGVDKAKKAHDFRETDLELCKLKGDVPTLTVEYWNATKELLDLLPYEQNGVDVTQDKRKEAEQKLADAEKELKDVEKKLNDTKDVLATVEAELAGAKAAEVIIQREVAEDDIRYVLNGRAS